MCAKLPRYLGTYGGQRHQPLKPLAHMPGLSTVQTGAGQGCSFSADKGPSTICPLPQIRRLYDDIYWFPRCDYVQVAVLGNCHHRDQNGSCHLPQAFLRPAAGATTRRRRACECVGRRPALSALLPLWRFHRRRVHESELVSTHPLASANNWGCAGPPCAFIPDLGAVARPALALASGCIGTA